MNSVKKYVESLFDNAPKSKKNNEIKEELILDLEEKYKDLIKEGKTPKQAYNDVIAGIGDIDEILEQLEDSMAVDNLYYEEILKRQKTKGLVISGSVFLYVLSFIWIILFDSTGFPDHVVMTGFFLISGIATCILIYYNISTPKIKTNEMLLSKKTTTKTASNDAVRRAISGILWPLIVVIYFIISFTWRIWYISWVMFIIGGLIESIIDLVFSIKGDKNEK